ncbi:hypothetical protein ACHAXS_001449 [Conticribra weissflogii]
MKRKPQNSLKSKCSGSKLLEWMFRYVTITPDSASAVNEMQPPTWLQQQREQQLQLQQKQRLGQGRNDQDQGREEYKYDGTDLLEDFPSMEFRCRDRYSFAQTNRLSISDREEDRHSKSLLATSLPTPISTNPSWSHHYKPRKNRSSRNIVGNISDEEETTDTTSCADNSDNLSATAKKKSEKTVRFVLEHSIIHHVEKVNTDEFRHLLYYSKSERNRFAKEIMHNAKIIRHHIRDCEMRTTTKAFKEDSPDLKDDDEEVGGHIQEKEETFEELLHGKPPSISQLPPNCPPEAIVGIEHLVTSKKVTKALLQLRSLHTREILQAYLDQICGSSVKMTSSSRPSGGYKQDDEGNEDDVAEKIRLSSLKYSTISATSAISRAAYVANLE